MNIKAPLALAGAVALALGVSPLALAQQHPGTPSSSTATAPMSSPTMMTSAGGMGNMQHNMGNMQHSNVNLSKSQIMSVQRALRNLGYYIQADGIWGQGTTDDIKDLQFRNGLKVTGRPNADTMRALGLKGNQGLPGTKPISHSGSMNSGNSSNWPSTQKSSHQTGHMNNNMNGMNGNQSGMMNNGMHQKLSPQQIMTVQRALNQHGEQVPVNGQWGQQSRQAVMKFQKQNGIQPTGQLNAKTMQALGVNINMNGMNNGMSGNMMNHGNRQTENMNNMNGSQSGMMNSDMNNMHGNMNGMAKLTKGQIMHVQMDLAHNGYRVDQNGQWNNKTRSALIRFQKQNGLKTTGYPDMKTLQALGISSQMWQSWGNSNTMNSAMGTP